MPAKTIIGFIITGIFGVIFLLFFFAWGGSLMVGAVGTAICLLLYALITLTPLSRSVIRIAHRREPSNDRVFNALLVAVSLYYAVLRIAAQIAGLFLLICRLIISLVMLICTRCWKSAYVSFYLSQLPLKIFMVLSSPFEALIEWLIKKIDFNSVAQVYES